MRYRYSLQNLIEMNHPIHIAWYWRDLVDEHYIESRDHPNPQERVYWEAIEHLIMSPEEYEQEGIGETYSE